MVMQAHGRDGFKFNLGYQKGDWVLEIILTLQALAEEAGHDTIIDWVKSETFDPDELVEEHGAQYRKTKFEGRHHHHYEWVKQLESSGQYLNEYRVGLVLVTKKVHGKIEFVQFSARKFWGLPE